MKLVQKQFLKATREFELSEDAVLVRINGLLKTEKSTVSLSMLDPEPVINGSELEFHDRNRRGPLLTLILNNPSIEEFNRFIETLRKYILNEATVSTDGVSPGNTQVEAPGWNVYDEPPDFDEAKEENSFKSASPDRIEDDINMLKTYLDEKDIGPFIESLEALKAEPQSEAAFQGVVNAYNALGSHQGAVLTYSTYLKVLLSSAIWS